MKLKPVQDFVLIKLDPFEETFDSDSKHETSVIIRPAIAKEKPKIGTIIAVGKGRAYSKIYRQTEVNNGDRVIVDWATGVDMQQRGSPCLIVRVREPQILGVIE